jgi:hypothetical protein
MTWANVIPKLQERLETVDGLKYVLCGAPTAVHDTPMAFFLYGNGARPPGGQVKIDTYVVLIRVLVQWQDNKEAELELAPFINSIPDVFKPAPGPSGGNYLATLDGTVNDSRITDIRSASSADGWYSVGESIYRSALWELTLTDKTGSYRT